MGATAVALGPLAVWMASIVRNFLDDLIPAVGLLAPVVLTRAIFAPAWLGWALEAAHRERSRAIALVGILFAGGLRFLLVIVPVLVR